MDTHDPCVCQGGLFGQGSVCPRRNLGDYSSTLLVMVLIETWFCSVLMHRADSVCGREALVLFCYHLCSASSVETDFALPLMVIYVVAILLKVMDLTKQMALALERTRKE